MSGPDIPLPVLLIFLPLSLLLAWLSGTLAGGNIRACRALKTEQGIFLVKCLMFTYSIGCLQTIFTGLSIFFLALSIGNTSNSTWKENCEILTFGSAVITAGICLFYLLWSSMLLDKNATALKLANIQALPGEIRKGKEIYIRKILRGLRYVSFIGMMPFLLSVILVCLIPDTESENVIFNTSVIFFYAAMLRFITAMGRVSFIAFRRAEKRTWRARLKEARLLLRK